MKIVTVLGARPQFIKAASVSRALVNNNIKELLVHTGQHFDTNMSQIFFDEMGVPVPAYNLEIQGLNHGAMTGRMLEKIEEVLLNEKPDCVLVYGDTNSTLAGALAASKLHIPVAHVEAGLRSHEMRMPEEINRILTDRISTFLFCPTQTSIENLQTEGFENFGCEIHLTGDVMYDAVLHYHKVAKKKSTIFNTLGISTPYVLATIHRAENTNDLNRLKAICEAINSIQSEMEVIIPLHPRTRQFLKNQKIDLKAKIIEPVGYMDMLMLLEGCQLVMTDSGGLQKEAYFFEKYCITLRDQTEWVELVEAGVNSLVGANKERILEAFQKCKNKKIDSAEKLYGNGQASQNIATILNR